MSEAETNKAKIARAFGVSVSTVYKTLGKVDPAEQRERRNEAMAQHAEIMQSKISEILKNFDIPASASLTQKGVILGILTDKVDKIDRRLSESKQEDAAEAAPVPATIEGMMAALRNEMRAIGVIVVERAEPALVAEVRRTEVELGHKLIDVEGEIVDGIDGLDG
jgi:hypothetical protein